MTCRMKSVVGKTLLITIQLCSCFRLPLIEEDVAALPGAECSGCDYMGDNLEDSKIPFVQDLENQQPDYFNIDKQIETHFGKKQQRRLASEVHLIPDTLLQYVKSYPDFERQGTVHEATGKIKRNSNQTLIQICKERGGRISILLSGICNT